mmetsp:Transcript_3016/g.5703  ORF Transcript_3016/g.5703 Transcript_3016/m.5703 type:complete len:220 (+) Transcript_3016:24-683(+)|eukprot:CAMPEP_0175138792 /NCGR_PEP_ID=MMETSP0087-20121206/10544_1 /TAXON_ID=136419 /ORGANISM="Unknown Unknown, Strain D1" /LENGTH=219 /DNA_ID=CAMNT_0016421731 /DNA_START=28 /DNA_END=687 /DNA_ORIENTATION=+
MVPPLYLVFLASLLVSVVAYPSPCIPEIPLVPTEVSRSAAMRAVIDTVIQTKWMMEKSRAEREEKDIEKNIKKETKERHGHANALGRSINAQFESVAEGVDQRENFAALLGSRFEHALFRLQKIEKVLAQYYNFLGITQKVDPLLKKEGSFVEEWANQHIRLGEFNSSSSSDENGLSPFLSQVLDTAKQEPQIKLIEKISHITRQLRQTGADLASDFAS